MMPNQLHWTSPDIFVLFSAGDNLAWLFKMLYVCIVNHTYSLVIINETTTSSDKKNRRVGYSFSAVGCRLLLFVRKAGFYIMYLQMPVAKKSPILT